MYINTHHFDVKFKWRSVACEFIGMMIYVFVGSASISSTYTFGGDKILISAFAQGLCLVFLVHVFAPISGAHFNPAITMTSMATRRIGVLEGLLYLIVQFLGAISGGSLSLLALPHGRLPEYGSLGACYIRQSIIRPPVEIGMGRAFVLETTLSFAIILVYYGSIFKPRHLLNENGFANGLDQTTILSAAFPIGAAMITAILTGSATGGCVNPARQFGTELLAWSWNVNSWVFYVAPVIGAILGGLIFEFVLTEPK